MVCTNKYELNLVHVQKWSFALEKTTDFELDLVYIGFLIKTVFNSPISKPVPKYWTLPAAS
jgi:hypothetical protein